MTKSAHPLDVGELMHVSSATPGAAMAAASWAWQFRDQLPRIDVKPARNLDDRLQSQAPLPPLNLPQLRPVDAASDGGRFLAEPQFDPARPHTFAEYAGGFVERGGLGLGQDRYMKRGRVHQQVADLMDRTVDINDE